MCKCLMPFVCKLRWNAILLWSNIVVCLFCVLNRNLLIIVGRHGTQSIPGYLNSIDDNASSSFNTVQETAQNNDAAQQVKLLTLSD